MIQKSYSEGSKIYIIPTPIGNIEDITIRAINILKEVSIVFSEDTRETKKLFKFYDIRTGVISNHLNNENFNTEKILSYLREGKDVAVVSDRGTPLINDPGYPAVRAAIDEGYKVISLPGATAFVPALVMSGMPINRFMYYGFLNNSSSKRVNELKELKRVNMTMVFYESPHRVVNALKDMLKVFGDREIGISREISKKFEEVVRGKITEVIEDLKIIKGEFVIVVSGNSEIAKNDKTITEQVNDFINLGYSKMDSMKLVSKETKLSKSEVYKEYLEE